MDTYTCPFCERTQETVMEWFTEAVGYERYLDLEMGEERQRHQHGLDYCACPECGKELPGSIADKVL